MLTFKQYLDEARFDSCEKRFGNVLFAAVHKMEKEADTEEESVLFSKLMDFMGTTESSGQSISPTAALRMFKELRKCKNTYPDILDPKTNRLYRGTYISYNQFRFSDWKIRRVSHLNEEFAVSESFVYKQSGPLSSWSTSPYSAFWFSHRLFGRQDFSISMDLILQTIGRIEKYPSNYECIPVLYEAKLPDNQIILNPDFSNKISMKHFELKGYEVVRMGKSPVKCTAMIHSEIFYAIRNEWGEDQFLGKRRNTFKDHDFNPNTKQLSFKF